MAEAIDWQEMNDDQFVERAETQIWLSAFASNNPRAPAHKEVDAAYDEARRREKPWLYQQAWNRAYRSCGYKPSEHEIELARPAPEGEANG